MDQDRRRKVRFTPKAPKTPTKSSPTLPKTEKSDEDKEADAQAKCLFNRFNENVAGRKSKVEKKASVQVAFGHGATSGSTTSIRTFGVRRDSNVMKSSDSELKDSAFNDWQVAISSYSAADDDGMVARSSDVPPGKISKGYQEPWGYHHTYYPTTLPLRRPNSGDPELLDEAEFGDSARKVEYNENIINPAKDLGLLDEGEKEKMFFFQLPPNLPVVKRSASRKGKEKAESSIPFENRSSAKRGCSLEELSAGCLGKMLVYKSGAVKLKLGDTLYDVSLGSDCIFAQEVAAINPVDKHCCVLGDPGKRAVVTPDIDSLLNNVINSGK